MNETNHEINQLPQIFIKGLLVILIALMPMILLNHAMQSFLNDELAIVQAAAEKAAQAEKALLEASDEIEQIRLEAELDVLKAMQYEEFYQKYKTRESYHYYGQFYEMFENMYNADVLFIGTSHATHGINPLYIEESNLDYSFYNFALNGATPRYYLDWYEVFKESGYPTPEYIIFCVDWFMCDDTWLWRRISFDDSPDKPIDIMRKIKATKVTTSEIASESKVSESESLQVEEVTEKEKINYWDIDELLTLVFNNIPVIYSRDRIPEMMRYYFTSDEINVENEPLIEVETDEESIPEVPVYTHTYLKDGAGNITSDFYKGYIPWDIGYGGGHSTVGYNNNESEWTAFTELLNKFQADGIKLIFVQAPEYISGRTTDDFDRNNERITQIANEYEITFLNYNDELISDINNDYTNFSDWGHLNQKGSAAFSKVLANDIKSLLQ